MWIILICNSVSIIIIKIIITMWVIIIVIIIMICNSNNTKGVLRGWAEEGEDIIINLRGEPRGSQGTGVPRSGRKILASFPHVFLQKFCILSINWPTSIVEICRDEGSTQKKTRRENSTSWHHRNFARRLPERAYIIKESFSKMLI